MFGLLFTLGVCTLLGAKALLLAKIILTKNCIGISGKTQILYALIFLTRYMDALTNYYSYPLDIFLPNVSFIALSYCIVLSIFFFHHESYQSKFDNFRIELLIIPCAVLSLLANYGPDMIEVLWAFSVYLESVAILPQLYMISRQKKIESVVYHYISLLSAYKLLMLIEGVYMQMYMTGRSDRISLAAGFVQLMFYCDFFMRDVPLAGELRGEIDPEAQLDVEKSVSPKELEAIRSSAESQRHLELQASNNVVGLVLSPASLAHKQDPALAVSTSEGKDATIQSSAQI